MTHPGTQWLPTPIHHRSGGRADGHLCRPGPRCPAFPAAPHSRYRPLTRAAPAGDGAAAPPAHGRHAARHAAEPAPAVA
jgi:hypothetical protein